MEVNPKIKDLSDLLNEERKADADRIDGELKPVNPIPDHLKDKQVTLAPKENPVMSKEYIENMLSEIGKDHGPAIK